MYLIHVYRYDDYIVYIYVIRYIPSSSSAFMMKFDGFDLSNFQVRANSEDLTAELVGGKNTRLEQWIKSPGCLFRVFLV